MEHEYYYDGLTERAQKVEEAESITLVMLHDNFDADWQHGQEPRGVMIFTEPVPPTQEELAWRELHQEMQLNLPLWQQQIEDWHLLADAQKDFLLKQITRFRLYRHGVFTNAD